MHRATPILAQLVACGWLGRAEALAALYHASRPAVLSSSLRTACLPPWPIEAAQAELPTRGQAAHAARQALRPLLASRAPHRQLLEAATQAANSGLNAGEIQALTIDCIARHLRAHRQARALKGHTS